MKRVGLGLRLLIVDRRGATAVEYGLILALVFLAILGSVNMVGGSTIQMWREFSAKIIAATG
jgi:pilus assembly protein Flp/PilA